MKRRLIAAFLGLVLLVSIFAVPASATSVVKVMKVNVHGARLRSGPGDYDVIVSLKKGTKVLYTGTQENAFYQVRTSGGKVGWIYKKFLSKYGAATSKQVYYTNKAVTMRRHARSGSSGVKRLKKNTLVLVYEIRGSWAYVKTLSGKGGYVKVSTLSKPS